MARITNVRVYPGNRQNESTMFGARVTMIEDDSATFSKTLKVRGWGRGSDADLALEDAVRNARKALGVGQQENDR